MAEFLLCCYCAAWRSYGKEGEGTCHRHAPRPLTLREDEEFEPMSSTFTRVWPETYEDIDDGCCEGVPK